MDITGQGIVLGLSFGGVHTALNLWRRRTVSVPALWAAIASGVAIPVGIALIRAAVSGDLHDLPPNWREYIGAAGAVAIGFAVKHVITSLRAILTRSATVEPPGNQQVGADPRSR